jgi:hypothetical protein
VTVSYAFANFLTGAVTADVPFIKGSKWSQTLNKQDSIDVKISLRDAENRALNIDALTTPWQNVIFAEDDASQTTLAVVLITDRSWDNDARVLTLTVVGVSGYFDTKAIIGPPTAATAALTLATGRPNTALDTVVTGPPATRGAKLVAQWLTWPGATMPFVLPAYETSSDTQTYPFLDGRYVGTALNDLTALDQGPDFQFTSQRIGTGVSIQFLMRAGTKNNPYLGRYVGSWSEGGDRTPVSKLVVDDDATDQASHAFGTGAATVRSVLWSRALNTSMVANGYPPMVTWDSSHSSVSVQGTLDAYVRENLNYAAGAQRTLSFTLKNSRTGDEGGPALGGFTVGDMADIDVSDTNYWLKPGLVPIRITGISGDEVGELVSIQCAIWPRS